MNCLHVPAPNLNEIISLHKIFTNVRLCWHDITLHVFFFTCDSNTVLSLKHYGEQVHYFIFIMSVDLSFSLSL